MNQKMLTITLEKPKIRLIMLVVDRRLSSAINVLKTTLACSTDFLKEKFIMYYTTKTTKTTKKTTFVGFGCLVS
jgi:hypothetical protein